MNKVSKVISLMIIILLGLNGVTLDASEQSYQQYEEAKASEFGLVAQSDDSRIAAPAFEGEAIFANSEVEVYNNVLNNISYSVFHDGYWYSPFYYLNSTGNGIALPEYLRYQSTSTETIDDIEYYTYNFKGSNVSADIIIHLENSELIFEIEFQNDSSKTVSTKTEVDFDTCLSVASNPGFDGCMEDYVPLYSQGSKQGVYLNSEVFDVNFYINYLGENTPEYSSAYPWWSGPELDENQINSVQDELLLDGEDTAVIFAWDDKLDPGQSITYSFSIGISEGVFVPSEKPSVSADDNQQTPEEAPLSEQQIIELFNVSAASDDGTDISSSILVDQSSVDYSTPGVYPVGFSVTDDGGTAIQTVNLNVTDTLPVITSNLSTLTIELGEIVNNPLQSYGVSATEIESGDLTSVITVDSTAVDYNATGMYPILFTVEDEEGNETSAEVQLEIVRPSINITDDLTPTIDVISNLTGNEQASSNEEMTLTDEQLIELFEVVNSDNLEIKVDQSSVDYSKPGDYQIIFTDTDGNNFVGTLTIVDILPTLSTNKDSVTISVGSDLADITSKLKIVASEINEDDLTSNVIFDDSTIDYDTAGSYELILTVQDQEGNTEVLTISIIIEELGGLMTTGGVIGKTLLILGLVMIALVIIKFLVNLKAKNK